MAVETASALVVPATAGIVSGLKSCSTPAGGARMRACNAALWWTGFTQPARLARQPITANRRPRKGRQALTLAMAMAAP